MINNISDQDPMDRNASVNKDFEKESEKPNYFGIITADVRYDDRLSSSQKLMFSELNALSNKRGYCYATNKYFMEIYKVDRRTIQRWIEGLRNCGHIIVDEIRNDKKEVLERRIYIAAPWLNRINNNVIPRDINVSTPQGTNATCNNISINNNTSTSLNKKNVIQNPPLGGDITSGVLTPVKQPRSGDRFLDKSFSQKEEKKGKPTPKAPKQRHMFQKARELLAEKKPLELLNKDQRAKAFGIARGSLKPMHDLKIGVKFHLGTAANYVARGIIAGFDEYQIIDRYRQALSERNADKPYGHKAWDLSSTVTLAFEKLDSDGLTIRERYEKNKPLRKKDDRGESSVDWDEWAKQFTTSANGKDA